MVVPGCPSEEDGSLSRCQMGKVIWSAVLWERKQARSFIVSGGAAHSPYVEADAMAQGMVALGIPADRIYLEPDALHTDENMYNAIRIARELKYYKLAVASAGWHSDWGCRMMVDWGQPCGSLPMDIKAVEARIAGHEKDLTSLRAKRVVPWLDIADQELERRRISHRKPRPHSFILYPAMGVMHAFGGAWIPHAPVRPTLMTWAQKLALTPSLTIPLPASPASPTLPTQAESE